MTVEEVIEELKQLPPKSVVFLRDGYDQEIELCPGSFEVRPPSDVVCRLGGDAEFG